MLEHVQGQSDSDKHFSDPTNYRPFEPVPLLELEPQP